MSTYFDMDSHSWQPTRPADYVPEQPDPTARFLEAQQRAMDAMARDYALRQAIRRNALSEQARRISRPVNLEDYDD